MFGKAKEGLGGRIDSLIGAGARIEGDLVFSGGLRVDGEVKGDIRAAASATETTVVISEQARVEGEVEVDHLIINGTVVGRVRARQSLEMQPKAKIVGDVEYALIEMHQGAVIEGRLLRPAGAVSEPMAGSGGQQG